MSESSKRKGIFFASSIGLNCDIIDLQEKLDCEMKFEKTYHIEENPTARDRKMNLKENLNKLENESDIDFIIISTGTNDISKLDLNKDKGELTDLACSYCERGCKEA